MMVTVTETISNLALGETVLTTKVIMAFGNAMLPALSELGPKVPNSDLVCTL